MIAILIILTLLAQLPLMLKVKLVEYDEAIFCDVARNIQRTGLPLRSIGSKGVFYFEHTPLYPYILSLYVTTSTLFKRCITTLFSLGCVLLLYNTGKYLKGQMAGFASALLLSIHPFFALYSHFLCMEIFLLFSLIAGLASLVVSAQGTTKKYWIAGVAGAIAVLLKEIALGFVAICGVYILTKLRRDRSSSWKTLAVVVIPPVTTLLFWMVWCWSLSPNAFAAMIRRWMDAAIVGGHDPRSSITFIQWARHIVTDLLGPGLTVLGGLSVIYSFMRRNVESLDWILLGYPVGAIALSFLVHLKEPRHLIGILPCIALFIGTKIDWNALLIWLRLNRLRTLIGIGMALAFLFSVSPMRLPLENVRNLKAWFDPLYAWRLFENDRYYNVLRLAGLYLHEHTDPEEVITVVHEATVTAYYANRHYYMLYTLPLEGVIRILEGTRYLVWDNEVFLALNGEEIRAVREYVSQHFLVETVVRDEYREVTIYRRLED